MIKNIILVLQLFSQIVKKSRWNFTSEYFLKQHMNAITKYSRTSKGKYFDVSECPSINVIGPTLETIRKPMHGDLGRGKGPRKLGPLKIIHV